MFDVARGARTLGALLTIATACTSAAAAQSAPSAPTPAPATPAPGRIGGRVVDAQTGRAVTSARVSVVGQTSVIETDLDGRFRSGPLAPGKYSVRAVLIGYRPVQLDSITVAAGQTAVVTVTLTPAAVQLQEVVAEAEGPAKSSSAAGLLAEQKNAAAVSDGISAETISRSPDSDAQAAVTRVTGVSVLDDKVVVRGLTERYSNTVLNGVEVASPDPDKKFVPLDIFPAGLLESLVATKTATPDRPGSFAGGSLDIRTREFPDNNVFTFSVSQSVNDQSTFRSFASPPRGGTDWFARDDGRRRTPVPDPANPERFAEAFRDVWTPGPKSAWPNTDIDLSIGGRRDLGGDVFGYVMAANYGRFRTFTPDYFTGLGSGTYTFDQTSSGVDLGGIFNLAYRVGTRTKFAFKNFYSRSGEDYAYAGAGIPAEPNDAQARLYQMNYRERFVWQSQLAGEHLVGFPWRARVEWRGTYGKAGNDDVDNRQLTYLNLAGDDAFRISPRIPNYRSDLILRDRTVGAQLDYAVPLALRGPDDGELKFGGLISDKRRQFDGVSYGIGVLDGPDVLALPPEQLLAPENNIQYVPSTNTVFPYLGRERVLAGYGMADVGLLPGVRFVGGLRVERWRAAINIDARDLEVDTLSSTRSVTDYLWSGNLTIALSDRMNLRFAGSRTTVRPELRELAPGGYVPLVGGLLEIGNPALKPSRVLNGDARIEWYPGAGELLALSVFYKDFKEPIVTTVVLAGDPTSKPANGSRGYSAGLELEARKSLGFLGGLLRPFALGANVTVLKSRVRIPETLGAYPEDLAFPGQSPYLINGSLSYVGDHPRLAVTALVNRFGDRIVRYGIQTGAFQSANVEELGRTTIDVKLKLGVFPRVELSAAGKNLTNPQVVQQEDRLNPGATQRSIAARYRLGRQFSLGMSYAP